ncbi:MAG: hypothetical protein NTY15_17575 [Planctomycetota bacterium]|nr:hypothetical protein [Planctomycetota bacterium]
MFSKKLKIRERNCNKVSRATRRLYAEKLEDRRVLALFVVTTLSDAPISQSVGDGFLSLREAIEAANQNVSIDGSPVGSQPDFFSISDKIVFSVTGKITLQAGELKVDQDVEISGPGADQLTIDANNNSRVLNLTSGLNRISGLTLTNGRARLLNSDGFGGGIYNNSGAATVQSVVISNCFADLDGGGIFGAQFRSFSAIESSILNNIAGRNGGGIFSSGAGRFRNVTIAGNLAIAGGGIFTAEETNLPCESCTIVGNTAVEGGGIYQVTQSGLFGSIVAGNLGSGNIESNIGGPVIFSPGNPTYSLFGGGTGTQITDGVNGNRIISDWKTIVENNGVKPLVKQNGGTTPTILPLADGPAIDKGNPGYQATAVDQRGFPRIVDADNDGNAIVDIGAVELDPNIRVRISGASVNEASSSLRFNISLGRRVPVGSTLSFQFSILGGNATANQDFTPVSRTFSLNSTSQIAQFVDIPILQDNLVENNETLVAVLSDIQGGVIETGFSTAVGTIVDDDVPGFNVNKTATTVTEDGVTMVDTVSVVLTAPPVVSVGIILQNVDPSNKPIAAVFSPPFFIFTPSNWNVPQQASIKGVDDAFDDGDQVFQNEF